MLAFFFVASTIIAACTKEEDDVKLDPALSTSQILNLKSDSATVVGFVIAKGDGFTEKGIVYSTEAAPTIDNDKAVYKGAEDKATFNVAIGGLNYATKYYARAYATNASGTIYGEEMTFTTLPVVPTLTTGEFAALTGTTASGTGNVTNNGGAEVTARGIVYGTSPDPTVANDKTTDGAGVGEFTSALSGLRGLTTYYVRTYATNSAGTAYGPQVSFTTPQAIVTLWVAGDFQGWNPGAALDSLMNSEADQTIQGYVNITNTNGFKFTSQKNWDGPNYGIGASAGTLSTTGDNLSVTAPGYYLFNINLSDLTYTATKTSWGIIGSGTADQWNSDQNMTYSPVLRKWVATIPLTAAEIKFRANDDWDLNYGDTGNDGKLEAGGDNIPVTTAGTYTLMLDLSSPRNYKYTMTQWGIIGSATAGGWDSDTDLTPNADNTWTITTTLNAGEIKFRANNGWDINYGGSGGNIAAGGANIAVATAGTYTITLDLVNGTYTIVP
jgi:hypothetical protein